jgi:N-acetylmuramoyl-L-alanine amidase
MKNLLILLLILLVTFVSFAQADGLTIEPYAGGFHYAFQADDDFLVLQCKSDTESAQVTVFAENGEFSGDIALPHTFSASPLKVTVETLKGREILSAKTETVAAEQPVLVQNLPEETKSRKLSDIAITPLVNAMQYHFLAPGHASLLLKYRSSTEKGTVTIYAGGDYAYDGVLPLPYTYANNYVVLTVADLKNNGLFEEMLRTAYPVPEAPAQGTGRLNGITVCIDPGHQEAGQYVAEAIGPGLSGTKKGDIGMARGTATRRMESIVALEIGLLLRDALLREGAAVVMTRDTQDTYVSNIRRAEIAAEAGADFFLRLHCDSRENASAQGIGIFCPYGSDYAKAIADRDGWQAMGEILLSAMQKTTGQTKGAVATTNQYVGNNWAAMPSFLVEMGYMSNPVEDVLLSAPQYQQMLVDGMVEGIYELAVKCGLLTI